MQVDAPQRISWDATELYQVLTDTFPALRTRQQKVLDVELLAKQIGMSKEGIYKWLRAGSIKSKKGFKKIVQAANSPENVAALTQAGRTPPTEQDLVRFFLG